MEEKIIQEFCKTLDTTLLKNISSETSEFFIDNSYTCLFQKYGNKAAAETILSFYKEIINVSGTWISQKNHETKGFKALKRIGVVTLPVIDSKDIPKIREKFIDTLRDFPEYRKNPDNPDLDGSGNPRLYVLGGFAGLANPASFHNDLVRSLRKECRNAVLPLFRELINSYANDTLRKETKLEMLFDRMMYRQKSQEPSAETWHRDVISPEKIEENDELFGGWLNLDTDDQYFSCIPGSHLGVRQKKLEKGKFVTIPKEEIDIIGKYRYKFSVPPGHIVIFPQYILHEVLSKKSENNMMRVFTGWRTTVSKDYLHQKTKEMIEMQAAMQLPSGQIPPMFAASHENYYRWKQFKPIPNKTHKVNLIEWSVDTFSEKLLIKYEKKQLTKANMQINDLVATKTSEKCRIIKITGSIYKIKQESDGSEFDVDIKDLYRPEYKQVARFPKSLAEYNLQMYTPYAPSEMALYKPQKILY